LFLDNIKISLKESLLLFYHLFVCNKNHFLARPPSFIRQESDDLAKGLGGILFQIRLPNAKDFPSHFSQFSFVPIVAFDISKNFFSPKGRQFVVRALDSSSVPKITINEHTIFFPWERYIGTAGNLSIVFLKIYSAFPKMIENYFFQ
jgi:hypothetical protein